MNNDKKKSLWMCPSDPGKLFNQLSLLVQDMGLAGTIEVTTPDITALTAELKEVKADNAELKAELLSSQQYQGETSEKYNNIVSENIGLTEALRDLAGALEFKMNQIAELENPSVDGEKVHALVSFEVYHNITKALSKHADLISKLKDPK